MTDDKAEHPTLNPGQLVRALEGGNRRYGIIASVVNTPETVPPVIYVMYSDGELEKEWADECEIIDEDNWKIYDRG
ncbi:hypothetical protein OAA09_01265 [bacterium]|nr:hypothetical protein [bacterium]